MKYIKFPAEAIMKKQISVYDLMDKETKEKNEKNALATFYEVSTWTYSQEKDEYVLWSEGYFYFSNFLTANTFAKQIEKLNKNYGVRTKLIRIRGNRENVYEKEELLYSTL